MNKEIQEQLSQLIESSNNSREDEHAISLIEGYIYGLLEVINKQK